MSSLFSALDGIVWLELNNSFLFFMSLGMCIVFSMIMWREREHVMEPWYGGLIGFNVFVIGEMSRQMWYWSWRYFTAGSKEWLMGYPLAVLYMFSVIVMIGAACTIRNFTRGDYGHKVYLALIGFAVVGAILSLFLPR